MSSSTPAKHNPFAHVAKCGAKNRAGGPCGLPAMANGRCRLHGGKTPNGIATGSYKGKGYSKVMPIDLLNAYKEIRSDPEILSLRDEIALVTARIRQLIPRLTTGEAKSRWLEVKETWKILRMAQKRQDAVTLADAVEAMNKLLSDADQDYRIWDDLYKAMGAQQRLITQEQKRMMDMNALISTEDAVSFVSEILSIVKDTVTDKQELHDIYVKAQGAMSKRRGMMTAVGQGSSDDAE